MAFPTGAIDLKAVCDAYGVASNIGALRGKKYYTAASVETTIPASGSFSLGDFKGRYATNPSVTSLIVGTPSIGYIRSTPFYYSGTSGPYASIDYIIKYKTLFGSVKSIYIDHVYFNAFTSPNNTDTFYNYVGIEVSYSGRSIMAQAVYDTASFTTAFGITFDNKYNNEFINLEIPIDIVTGQIRIIFNMFNKDHITTRTGSNKRFYYIFYLDITSSTVSLSSFPPYGAGYP